MVNYGRIGADGQTKVKDFGDAGSARAEMTKVAASKRKKGYADTECAAPAPAAKPVVIAPVALDQPQAATLTLDAGGRKTAVELKRDGDRSRPSSSRPTPRPKTPPPPTAALKRP